MAPKQKPDLKALVVAAVVVALGLLLVFNWVSGAIDETNEIMSTAESLNSSGSNSTSDSQYYYAPATEPLWLIEGRERGMQDNDPFDGNFYDPGDQDRICDQPQGVFDYDCNEDYGP